MKEILFLVASSSFISGFECAPPRDLILPPMTLDFVHIKTPQLIGIGLGCLVFTITIATVIYLLYLSGSFSRLLEELRNNQQPSTNIEKPVILPGLELYDHLLSARLELPRKPSPPLLNLKGSPIIVRPYNSESDEVTIIEAFSGCAQYDASAYDPSIMWSWMHNETISKTPNGETFIATNPIYYEYSRSEENSANSTHLVVIDKELQRQIGMISLVDNCPINLSIRMGQIFPYNSSTYLFENIYLLNRFNLDNASISWQAACASCNLFDFKLVVCKGISKSDS